MTFSIQTMDKESQNYKEFWETILRETEKKLNLFQTHENILFEVSKTPGYTYQYRLTSGSLPVSLLGVWAYSVVDMRLNIHVYYNEETQTLTASPNFSYAHRGGGTNGCGLSDMAETSFKVICSLTDKTSEIQISNYDLFRLVQELQDMAEEIRPKTLNDEQESEFNLYAATKVKQRGELTTEEKRQIINLIGYYIHHLKEWEKQGKGYRYSFRSTNEIFTQAENTVRELNYSIYREKNKEIDELVHSINQKVDNMFDDPFENVK